MRKKRFVLSKKQQKMVEKNYPLAIHIAVDMYKKGYGINLKTSTSEPTLDDFVSAATMGLIYSVREYNKSLGKFSTYAYKTITGRILTFLFQENREIKTRREKIVSVVSLNKPITKLAGLSDAKDMELEGSFPDNSSFNDISMIECMDIMERALDKREYGICYSRIFEGLLWPEIAARYNCTINTVTKIYDKGLTKLKRYM